MYQLADVNKEYEKNIKLKKEDVENLKIWTEKQPHLPKISELQCILFLQSCYYSSEQAKSAIENFFTVRTLCKDIFRLISPSDPAVQMAMDVGLNAILPKTDLNGYKILWLQLLDTNTDKYVFLDQVAMFDMTVLLLMHLNGTNEGINIVFDFKGSVFGHVLKVQINHAAKYMFYLQEALPIRLKVINIINAPTWIDRALSIFKQFMKKELFDLIQTHTTMETFYKTTPQELLPKTYGGKADSSEKLSDDMRALLIKHSDFIKDLQSQQTNESKRMEKATDYDKIFGMEGTFKKLEVD